MIKKIYFHLEVANGNCFELLVSAYKNQDMQLESKGLGGIKCYEELCNTSRISRELLNEMYKCTYGSPIGKNCRVTLDEIKSVRGTNIGLLDVNKALKYSELGRVIANISEHLSDNNLKIKDVNCYRVIVEVEK